MVTPSGRFTWLWCTRFVPNRLLVNKISFNFTYMKITSWSHSTYWLPIDLEFGVIKTKITDHYATHVQLVITQSLNPFVFNKSGQQCHFYEMGIIKRTSLDRIKSAPYPRLKNSKRTSNCQFTVLKNRKSKKNGQSGAPGPASARPLARSKGDTFEIVNIFVAVEGGLTGEKTIFRK